MCNVIIIGAGQNSKVVADIVLKNGDTLLGFLDDNKTGKIIGDYQVIGKIDDCQKFASQANFIISIGDNQIRKPVAKKFDLNWYTAIHPSAQIGIFTDIGEGSCIMANAVVNANSKIGKHCIINSACVIEHDNIISDYVHISPNATICGDVVIGEGSHIGAGAVVKNSIRITENVVVGIGAAIVKNIETAGKYIGVPARKM